MRPAACWAALHIHGPTTKRAADHGEGGGAGGLGLQGPEADDEAAVLHVGVPRVYGVLHTASGLVQAVLLVVLVVIAVVVVAAVGVGVGVGCDGVVAGLLRCWFVFCCCCFVLCCLVCCCCCCCCFCDVSVVQAVDLLSISDGSAFEGQDSLADVLDRLDAWPSK